MKQIHRNRFEQDFWVRCLDRQPLGFMDFPAKTLRAVQGSALGNLGVELP